jgi:hypothetical protein
MNRWNASRVFLTIMLFALVASGVWHRLAYGQATSGAAAGVSCPADGSSAQVLASNARRVSWSIINDSITDIRVGFLASGTADLTDSNSFVLKAGASYADSLPNVYAGRVVCMSTTGSSVTAHYTEATK